MTKAGPKPMTVDHPKFQRLIEALAAGNYVAVACKYADIGESTVYKWLAEARDEFAAVSQGRFPDKEKERVVEMADAINSARAEAETRNVFFIQKAAKEGTWQAAAWWLERTAPKRWGRFVRTEITGPDDGPVQVAVTTRDLEAKLAQLIEDVSDGDD
jgi:hypothetical protein